MAKAKTKKKASKKVVAKKPAEKKARGVRGKSGFTVCETWIKCFENKKIKTAEQCTKAMLAEFPGRESAIFFVPNIVIGRCARGLLDHGKKHNFKKYPVAKKKAS